MTTASPSSTADRDLPAAGDAVRGRDGLRGEVDHVVDDNRLIVRLLGEGQDVRRVLVYRGDLRADPAGGYAVDLSPADVDAADKSHRYAADDAAAAPREVREGEEAVIPVLEERVRVEKQRVETGKVRVRKVVEEHSEQVSHDLLRQEARVERVPVNRPVDDPANPPQARQEGDVLVIPLLEEVLVVQKRLVLREELRITRADVRHQETQDVTLRKERAEIDRTGPDDPTESH